MIYLDHNATTPLDEEVNGAMIEAFPVFGNPSSAHRIGRSAKALVERSRQQVAALIGCEPSEIVFTSGGTEANNLAILGTAERAQRGHLITTVIEHPSVTNPLRWLEQRGFEVTCLPVDGDGRVSPEDVRDAIRKDTVLITVMHANNETGVLQPIREIGHIARESAVAFHTDAAQSVGKMGVSVSDLMVEMMTVVSHKFYGPKGIGALYIRGFNGDFQACGGDAPSSLRSHFPKPLLFGAGHERGLRPGTENVTGIAGLGTACAVALRDRSSRYEQSLVLRDRLFGLLRDGLEVMLNGHREERLPNTLNVSIRGIISEDLVAELGDAVAFSSGSACHAGIRKPSAVLKAMGLSDEDALSSVRLSLGKDNTMKEIEEAAEIIINAVRRLQDTHAA